MLKTKIKASQIANLTDARYFSAWEVDWLGFSLDPASDAYVDPKTMMAMREWLEGPAIVGEFGVATVDSMREAYELLKLDFIQVGPFQGANVLGLLEGIPVIKELVVDSFTKASEVAALLDDCAPFVRFFLVDFEKNGITWAAIKEGKSDFTLEDLKGICKKHSVLLSLEIPADEIETLLEEVKPLGLNVQGGSEEKVGFKSFDELDEVFEELEIFV